MRPTNIIGFLINHLSASLMRQSDLVLQEKLGIGFSQFKLLRVLEVQPHIQQRQIADALGQTEASISRQIKLLHDKNLLQTTVSPTNRRQHITTLTDKGVRCAEEAIDILHDYHRPMFDTLTPQQQQDLLEILQTLHQYTCQHGTGACMKFTKK